jgi:diguanylate cyclase (GGDEF)-like protein/PAS domain S-box-containing protein
MGGKIMPAFILRPDVIPLWIGIGLTGYLLLTGIRSRHSKLGVDFTVLMSLALIWQVSYAINIMTSILWLIEVMVFIEVGCMSAIPIILLVFAGRLTRRPLMYNRNLIICLCILPAIISIMTITNDLHQIIYTGFSEVALSTGFLLIPNFGPWFVVIGIYSFLLILVTMVVLVDWFQKATPANRGQAAVLFFGILPPVIANVTHTSGFFNLVIDPTPLAFSVSGIILLWGLGRYGLLDMLPIAREIVFENISDGVIVLDNQESVMDINPAAAKLFDGNRSNLIGRRMRDLIHRLDTCLLIVKNEAGEYDTLRFGAGDQVVDYEIRTSPIHDKSGMLEGKIILLNDVTERRKLEDELRILSSLDHLTGLMNRRTFFLELTKQIRLARRFHYQLTVCMMDLDRFKMLNDQYGHQVGDDALAQAATRIQNSIRISDIAARYGGDELAMLLIHTGERGAQTLCKRVSDEVGNIVIRDEFKMGVSIGLSSLKKDDPDTGETIIARADRALYKAKARGRGLIVVE